MPIFKRILTIFLIIIFLSLPFRQVSASSAKEELCYTKGILYLKLGNYKEALEFLKCAQEENQKSELKGESKPNPYISYYKGICYMHLEKYDESINSFEESLKITNNIKGTSTEDNSYIQEINKLEQDIKLDMAIAKYKIGNYDESKDYFIESKKEDDFIRNYYWGISQYKRYSLKAILAFQADTNVLLYPAKFIYHVDSNNHFKPIKENDTLERALIDIYGSFAPINNKSFRWDLFGGVYQSFHFNSDPKYADDFNLTSPTVGTSLMYIGKILDQSYGVKLIGQYDGFWFKGSNYAQVISGSPAIELPFSNDTKLARFYYALRYINFSNPNSSYEYNWLSRDVVSPNNPPSDETMYARDSKNCNHTIGTDLFIFTKYIDPLSFGFRYIRNDTRGDNFDYWGIGADTGTDIIINKNMNIRISPKISFTYRYYKHSDIPDEDIESTNKREDKELIGEIKFSLEPWRKLGFIKKLEPFASASYTRNWSDISFEYDRFIGTIGLETNF